MIPNADDLATVLTGNAHGAIKEKQPTESIEKALGLVPNFSSNGPDNHDRKMGQDPDSEAAGPQPGRELGTDKPCNHYPDFETASINEWYGELVEVVVCCRHCDACGLAIIDAGSIDWLEED